MVYMDVEHTQEDDAGFLTKCKVELSLDQGTYQKASLLFNETRQYRFQTGNVEKMERFWSACILFVIRKFSLKQHSFTLSQVLQAAAISIIEFLKEFPQFVVKASPVLRPRYGEGWEKQLQINEIKANWMHMSMLFSFYKRVYKELFKWEDESLENGAKAIPKYMRFGWMLFLALRTHVLSRSSDLVTCTTGLIAIIIIMTVHMPTAMRNFSFDDKTRFVKGDSEGVNVTAALCSWYDASEEEVSKIYEKANRMIGKLLNRNENGNVSECMAGVRTEGLFHYDGLMEEASLDSNLSILEKDYVDAYHKRGDLDERMFMTEETDYSELYNRHKHKGYSKLSLAVQEDSHVSLNSPVQSGGVSSKLPPPTPVSVTMTTAKWLRIVISPLPSDPPFELQTFFKSCDQDITNDVVSRAKVLLERVFPCQGLDKDEASTASKTWAEQRRLEALKLYYRVLKAKCQAESQRLHSNNLTAALKNENLHRCMLACSAELVLFIHKKVDMTFPAVLEPMGITAFDLGKVVEDFMNNEETLPKDVKRYLSSIEERVVENMAWEKGSSMYYAMAAARPALAPEIRLLGLLPTVGSEIACDPSPTTNMLPPRPWVSPLRERQSAFSTVRSTQPPLHSTFASPQTESNALWETSAESCINGFLEKVSKLAKTRIKSFCESLQHLSTAKDQVYGLFHHALNNVTNIFFRRHIDQIILCSIYGFAKVKKLPLTFKDIVDVYERQPQHKTEIFRHVLIGQNDTMDTGPINRFYNEVFVPATKHFLMRLAIDGALSVPVVCVSNEATPTSVPQSPRRVDANQKVVVNRLDSTKVDCISPHPTCIVEDSSQPHESPSKDLNMINSRLKERIGGDDAPSCTTEPAAQRHVPDSVARGEFSSLRWPEFARPSSEQETPFFTQPDSVLTESEGPAAKRRKLDS